MRYLLGFVFALALGAMGCSETTGTGGSGGDGGVGGDGGAAGIGGGGVGGDGGSAGIGGGAGTGGTGGEPVSDCSEVDTWTACVVDGSEGLCVFGGCRLLDCSGLTDGTVCALFVGPGGSNPRYGWCEGGACTVRVSDCTGFQDGVFCGGLGLIPGSACVDGSCEALTYGCAEAEDGTPCLDIPDPDPFIGAGFCVGGSCEPPQ